MDPVTGGEVEDVDLKRLENVRKERRRMYRFAALRVWDCYQ